MNKSVQNRGTWSSEEDALLKDYMLRHGCCSWSSLPKQAGLKRSGKSCRLRWMNYLRPGIKRGNFTSDEDDLIVRLHRLLGNRWALIAGRLPGRTDNEIKNYWNTHLSKIKQMHVPHIREENRRNSEDSSQSKCFTDHFVSHFHSSGEEQSDVSPYAIVPDNNYIPIPCSSSDIAMELNVLEDLPDLTFLSEFCFEM